MTDVDLVTARESLTDAVLTARDPTDAGFISTTTEADELTAKDSSSRTEVTAACDKTSSCACTREPNRALRRDCLLYYMVFSNLLTGIEVRWARHGTYTSNEIYRLLLSSNRILKHLVNHAVSFCYFSEGWLTFSGSGIRFFTQRPGRFVILWALVDRLRNVVFDVYVLSTEQTPIQTYLIEMIYKAYRLKVQLRIPPERQSRVIQQVLADLKMDFYGVPILQTEGATSTVVMANQLWKGQDFHVSPLDLYIDYRPPYLTVSDGYLAELFDISFYRVYLNSINFLVLFNYLPLSPKVIGTLFYCSAKFLDLFEDSTFEIYRQILDEFRRVRVGSVELSAILFIDCIVYDRLKPLYKKVFKVIDKIKELNAEYDFLVFKGKLSIHLPVENNDREYEFIRDFRGFSERRDFQLSPDKWRFVGYSDDVNLQVVCYFEEEVVERLRDAVQMHE
ncbi:unnamed protein product [Bursaphelenchus okinawaensis]|uniref:Uncharacterized protein n=1 Tax=Bursaphelenchus okinawaensis TaxID=465554 RepID=A0A811L5L0_9BILA|nr:unnamed protein product [Bursaphelenchus okinawaensis]CAG9118192.1 unnamed protein product [Bursaphelenchus okinawaensis]